MPEWRQYLGLNSFLAAPAVDYEVQNLPRHIRRSMSRMSEMAALAALEALAQADLTPKHLPSLRVLLVAGSTTGSPQMMEAYFRKLFEKNGPEGQLSTTFFKFMSHSLTANLAAVLDFKGPALSVSCACATSAQAMILAWELMQTGQYDVAIVGGADELHYISTSVFDVVQAASRGFNERPQEASRPFSADRDGLVVAEGAGILILETEASVERRKVRRLAELRGGAYHCDGSHMTQSSLAAMSEVMSRALRMSGLGPADIDYVNAHATGTVQGDAEEAQAIAQVFGAATPVSSLKGHLGHTLAACGALEAIFSVKMLQESLLLPTRNLARIDDKCSGIDHVCELRQSSLRHILSNNFAFGGMNTSLVLSRVPGNAEA